MREKKRLEEVLSTEAELIRRSDDISAYFELAREGETVDSDLRRGAGRYPRSRLRAPVQSRQRCHHCAVSVRPPWTTLLPGASSRASPAGIFEDLTRDSDQRLAFQSRLIAGATSPRQRYSRRSRTLSFKPAYSCSSSSTMLTSKSRRHQIFSCPLRTSARSAVKIFPNSSVAKN